MKRRKKKFWVVVKVWVLLLIYIGTEVFYKKFYVSPSRSENELLIFGYSLLIYFIIHS